MEQLKCVVVGDGTVGKTAMLISYTTNSFPDEYVPTVFDNYASTLKVDDIPVSLGIWDTAGQEDFDRLRVLTYEHADVFILCFAVDQRKSYENIIHKWKIEVQSMNSSLAIWNAVSCHICSFLDQCPNVPYIVVGMKCDLREHFNGLITTEEGEKLCKLVGASKYVECSSLKQQGLKDVFDEAVRTVHSHSKKRRKSKSQNRCLIL